MEGGPPPLASVWVCLFLYVCFVGIGGCFVVVVFVVFLYICFVLFCFVCFLLCLFFFVFFNLQCLDEFCSSDSST